MRQVINFNNKNVILPEPLADDRFRLEVIEDCTITFKKTNNSGYSILQYSLDGENWSNFPTKDTNYNFTAGNNVYIRGKMTSNGTYGYSNKICIISGKCKGIGNIMYIYDYEHPENRTISYKCAFSELFNSSPGLISIELYPTILATRSYTSMFWKCTSLNKVITYAQDISASNCLNGWLEKVSATGDFYNLGGATYSSGDSGIPTGWTVHTSL